MMTPESFRQHAHQMVDWMADYLSQVEHYPVTPQTQPGDVLKQLPSQAPDLPEAFETIFRDFESQILPGMTHWQHPSFFAYFPASTSPPSLLAEMLMSTLGAQCMSWLTSPAATELEERVMEWLRIAIDLPSDFTGVIQDSASSATLCALLCARERASEGSVNTAGFVQQRFRVYASTEAHASVEKGVRIAGIGSDNLIKIPVDAEFAMDASALEQAILADQQQGYTPLCVVAAWGTTSSTALDPLAPIAALCQRHQIWMHVDAAYAGSAFILPEHRQRASGLEQADSMVFNPHKWLMTHFDCSAYFVKDPEQLTRTLGLTPEYLKTDLDRQVNNYRDWGIPLGRRFRALKLWFVLRSYGLTGLQHILRQHIQWVQDLSRRIAEHTDFEVLAPVPLNLVCFRYAPPDTTEMEREHLNQRLLSAVNETGSLFMTHTRLGGVYSLRLVAGNPNTTEEHIRRAWHLIQATAAKL
jgi:aromatic-L-amino-acid/L-tryptophan decarboxylase